VNHAERQNLNVRLFNRRFTRLTLGFSKKLANLEHSTALMVAFHNFCRPHNSLHLKATETTPAKPQTPAMASGLTDHVWTVHELISATIPLTHHPLVKCLFSQAFWKVDPECPALWLSNAGHK